MERIGGGFLWSSKIDHSMSPPMSSPIAESRVCPGCRHPEVDGLGNAGVVEFFQCRCCHDVVVVQGSRRWAAAAAIRED